MYVRRYPPQPTAENYAIFATVTTAAAIATIYDLGARYNYCSTAAGYHYYLGPVNGVRGYVRVPVQPAIPPLYTTVGTVDNLPRFFTGQYNYAGTWNGYRQFLGPINGMLCYIQVPVQPRNLANYDHAYGVMKGWW